MIEDACARPEDFPTYIRLTEGVEAAAQQFCIESSKFPSSSGPSLSKVANGTVIYMGIESWIGDDPINKNTCPGTNPNEVAIGDCRSGLGTVAACEYQPRESENRLLT